MYFEVYCYVKKQNRTSFFRCSNSCVFGLPSTSNKYLVDFSIRFTLFRPMERQIATALEENGVEKFNLKDEKVNLQFFKFWKLVGPGTIFDIFYPSRHIILYRPICSFCVTFFFHFFKINIFAQRQSKILEFGWDGVRGKERERGRG